MKPIVFLIIMFFFAGAIRSQEIAWFMNDQSSGHLASIHTGADVVTGYGFSYGYKFKGKIPFVIGTELTTPYGGQIMDDFEASLTAQTIFRPVHNMGISLKPYMASRRYGSAAAVIVNISAGLETTVGYYRNKWSIAAEAGYENNRATLLTHRLLKEYYPEIKDEWYGSTGGSFNFGLVASYWINATGISFKGGKTYGQDFSNHPTIPYYADFSLIQKF